MLITSLPRSGRVVGLLPESAPPWGHLGGTGHSAAPSTASMRQRGRRWREPDHRWSPAGTTGSLIHLEMEEEERGTQWTGNTALPVEKKKRWRSETHSPERTDCLFKMLERKKTIAVPHCKKKLKFMVAKMQNRIHNSRIVADLADYEFMLSSFQRGNGEKKP